MSKKPSYLSITYYFCTIST